MRQPTPALHSKLNFLALKTAVVGVLLLVTGFSAPSNSNSSTVASLTLSSRADIQAESAEIDRVLTRAQEQTWKLVESSPTKALRDHWNLPLYMGSNYVSQDYLLRRWLAAGPSGPKMSPSPFDEIYFSKLLLSSQLADGSWQPVPEPNLTSGNLDATVMNYWALKAMGQDINSRAMIAAKDFILSRGGLEETSAFSRIVLALFTQLSWDQVPWSPLFFIHPNNPDFINVDQFPQWVRPHIVPISYLRILRVQRDLGPPLALTELHAAGQQAPPLRPPRPREAHLNSVIAQMLHSQASHGSWGGYTSATLFTTAALDDFLQNGVDQSQREAIQNAILRGQGFVDQIAISKNPLTPYLGSVCDGRYWDTILILQGLTATNPTDPRLRPVTEFLKQAQLNRGGIPFGLDFETTPDVDDTAELITTLALARNPDSQTALEKAVTWMLSMQNSNGGWGAFDRNNTGNPLLRTLAVGLNDSATLFDPSTPDVTGHALEALASVGLNASNSAAARRAVDFLRHSTDRQLGLWKGRWGVNYIYGTTAALTGLIRTGVPTTDPLISHALDWIETRENRDGGFGETTASDRDPRYAGQGISTASQTAWALMALVRGGRGNGTVAKTAAKYLMENLDAHGRWRDPSVVGTGHSGIIYLVYPSYPVAFPLIALSEYQRQLRASATAQ